MQECVRLGLIVGFPGRLTPGETRVTRARKEIANLKAHDERILALREEGDSDALEVETNSEQWTRIHGRSLQVYEDVLAPTYKQGNEDDLPWIKLQLETAHTVNRITARFAVERYRGQRAGALARLMERLQKPEPEIETEVSGFLEGYDDA
jgi:hypothetical protein